MNPIKAVADAAHSWLASCERKGLERQTIKTYRSQWSNHIEPRIGKRILTDFRKADVRDFMDHLLDASVSHAMTRKVMKTLVSILNEALDREWIDRNVAAQVKMPKRSRHEKDAVVPTKAEIRLLIEKAPERWRPLIVTAAFTGMRISELRGLTWANVDFERRVIRVTQRADRLNEIGAPKSAAGRREIPMMPLVRETLIDWRERCPTGELALVFPNGKGKIESYGNFRTRVFNPLMIECGIVDKNGKPRFGIHALRHAAASLMIEQNWPSKKVQVFLGHSNISVTMDVYGHLFTRAEDDVALFEKLQEEFFAA
ncbi:site-specific integrase [Limibaculum sp. M0105]|uniref:Site-specific integrase n=1 Tax=Thermohalobaculum xanthum TaxID=2753746 RepID=A0A8J7SGR3_9RHOB|nr:site-specific integrase [Thermohalobaculum xanthum]MBK0401203.1 site-specific integrase [Thermohalobaculum xanthum]